MNNRPLPASGFVVFCGDDRESEEDPHTHILTTRRVFASEDEARTFASACASTRAAVVIPISSIQRLLDGWRH